MSETRILIVEDEIIVAKDVQAMLESVGYTVLAIALSGEEAIERVAETEPDLVLMDIKLRGELDGVEAAEQIRARFEVPVVYLTAYADDETLRRAKISEPFGYVVKPFGERELRSTVEMALYRHQMERKLRKSEERYRSLVENISEVIFTVDRNRVITYVSPLVEAISGYDPSEVLGHPFTEFIHPEDLPALAESFQRTIAGALEPSEYRVLTKSGETRWVRSSSRPILDGESVVGLQGTLVDITARKRAEEALERQAIQLATLNRVGRQVTSILDRQELLQQAVDAVRGDLDYLQAAILLVDEEADELHVAAATDNFWEIIPTGYRQPVGKGAIGIAAETGETVLVKDTNSDRRPYRAGEWLSPSSLSVPIEIGGRVIGVLEVEAETSDAFDENNVMVLNTLADQVATAFENARLYDKTRHRTAQLEALQDISLAITAQLELDEVLQEIVAQGCRLLEVPGAGLYLVDEAAGDLEQVVSHGYKIDRTGTRLAPGEGIAGKVLESGGPIYVDDYRHWEGRAPDWEDEGITGSLCVPLKRAERIIGTLGFDEIAKPRSFDERDVWLANLFANQAAVAIQNARLYEEISQRATELGILYDVATAAMTSVHLDEVLDRAMVALEETLQPDALAILLVEAETNELAIYASTGFPGGPELMRRSIGVGIPGSVVKTGQPALLSDVRKEERYHACDSQTRSELCVPLQVGDQVIGALNLESHRVAAFDGEDLRLLSILAGHLATMIENAQLYEQAQQEIAERRRAEAELRDRERFLALLSDITRAALETPDLPAMLQILADQLGDLFGADGCYLTLWDEETGTVIPMAAYGEWRGKYRSVPAKSDAVTMTASCLHAGRPLAVEDVYDTPYLSRRIAERFPDRSLLGLPLIAGDEKLGAALIAFNEPHHFTPEEIARGEQVAGQVALAVAKAELVAELRRYTNNLERRVAERTVQVREQVAQLEAILDSTADGIVVTAAEGDVVLTNRVAHTWLSQTLSPEEANDLRAMIQAMTRRVDERPAEGSAVELLELTGLDLELSAAPVAELDPEQAKAVVAIHDVTHLRAMDRMKTRFITNISHELKTPIAAIKILAHLMGKQPEKWREHWEPLTEEAEHLADLVEGILEIARLDAGRLEMTFKPTELNDMTERVIANYEALSRERGLTLTYRPSPSNPTVMADSWYMMEMLESLLTNAIQYTPEGGHVTVSVDEAVHPPESLRPRASTEAPKAVKAAVGVAENRKWVTVTVTDTGWGISEEEQSHVFERFFRGKKPRSMQISGTGLGLALTKEIVELHGGRITVESSVGEGSAFTIWLPVAN